MADALLLARARGLAVSVLGGGQDWAGRAVRDGGLVIDLRGTQKVEVDGEVATIGGGATADALIDAVAPGGWAAATGTVGAVGMAGLTMGGGYGPLCGLAGLAADNLVSAQVVLADGTIVDADDSREPDLMWALRGGGGNFGVVASLGVRLHPVPKVYRGQAIFPLEQALDVLVGYGQLLADVPDQLTVHALILTTPDGTAVLLLAPTFCGDADEGDYWLKRLAGLGHPVVARGGMVDYGEPLRQGDALFAPDQRHYFIRTRNLAALTADAARALVTVAAQRTSPRSAISVHHFHGAASRVAVEATAFGVRQDHFMVEIIASWLPDDDRASLPDGVDLHPRWADSVGDALDPYSLPGGYPNLLTADCAEQVAHAYGPNAARLVELKARYDPHGVFCATPLPPQR